MCSISFSPCTVSCKILFNHHYHSSEFNVITRLIVGVAEGPYVRGAEVPSDGSAVVAVAGLIVDGTRLTSIVLHDIICLSMYR